MGAGEKAWWLTLISGTIFAFIAGLFALKGSGLTRRTEVDKIYMGRVESLEKQLAEAHKENDAKDAVIYALQQQHIADLPCIERERQQLARIAELVEAERKLVESNGKLQVRLDKFIGKFIGAREPDDE